MKTLKEYEQKMQEKMDTPAVLSDPSGIACPECLSVTELQWAEKSLICKNPAMRRLVCLKCDFTKVVPVQE